MTTEGANLTCPRCKEVNRFALDTRPGVQLVSCPSCRTLLEIRPRERKGHPRARTFFAEISLGAAIAMTAVGIVNSEPILTFAAIPTALLSLVLLRGGHRKTTAEQQ